MAVTNTVTETKKKGAVTMAKKLPTKQTETTDVAIAGLTDSAWGSEEVTSSDVMIPKLLCMQGLSKLVAAEEATMGEVRNSLTKELVGGKGKPFEVIFFYLKKMWYIFEQGDDGEFKYVKAEPYDSSNQHWPYNEEINGVQIRRNFALNFYGIQPGETFPVVVSFQRMSVKAGRKIADMAAKLKALNQPMAAKVVKLDTVKQSNEKGTFYVFEADTQGRAATKKELLEAHKWYKVASMKTANVVVDESDVVGEATEATAGENF
jgi:hypothetical protein